MFYLLTIIPDNRFAFVCSIFYIVPEQSCSLVPCGGLEGQRGFSAVVPSEGWRCPASLPCITPQGTQPRMMPMGIKSPPEAQMGLGCWCAQQNGHFPGTAMLPSTSATGGSGNKRVCHGFRMPDGFFCLNHLPVASCTLGSAPAKAAIPDSQPTPLQGCQTPLLLLFHRSRP